MNNARSRTARFDDPDHTTVSKPLIVVGALLMLLTAYLLTQLSPVFFGRSSENSEISAKQFLSKKPFDYTGYADLAEWFVFKTPSEFRAARRALDMARLLAPNDPLLLRAELRVAHAAGDGRTAMERAADLVDRSPVDFQEAVNTLATLSDDPNWLAFADARSALAWKGFDHVLLRMCNNKFDRNKILLLAHKVARKRPIDQFTLNCIEHAIVNSGSVESAYHLRLVASPNQSGRIEHVFNGGFESQPIGSPFDWMLTAGGAYRSGFDLSIKRGLDFGRSGGKLVARFNGRPVQSALAYQYLALIPGSYRIKYATHEVAFNEGDAPQWVLRCADAQRTPIPLTWTTTVEENHWASHEARFQISKTCAGQHLSLEIGSKIRRLEGLRGTSIIDNVRIERE
jgi:hypothetical protein